VLPCGLGRLDGGLQEACEQDLQEHCQTTLEEMEKEENKRKQALNCLQQFKEDLTAPECR
jgi:demethoxyubiquinone hydroxylase (CLK1/Coq7/Cat5 family)